MISQLKVYERDTFSVKNNIYKGKGVDLRAEPPLVKLWGVPNPPPPTPNPPSGILLDLHNSSYHTHPNSLMIDYFLSGT